ncbi:hypothetical protein [Methylobacterium sp. Leaf94]|uniref:hypothetical protein n=1 Tax=Methylobacterium sp. Leaf94 TaxID=1736250 RepID=UPI0012E3742B|nr:hypothetical protein [Methylobacterium sp. Leaf94]
MSKPDVSYVLTLANLLRAGILVDPVPAYTPPARPQDMPVARRRLWGRLHVR